MAHVEYLTLLHQGSTAWNQWRERHPDTPVDLRHAEIQGVNLTGVYLNEADLSEASLYGVTLTGASLREADLTRAHFQHTILQGVDLTEADLYEADLRVADLSGANLTRSDLSKALLDEADLTAARAPSRMDVWPRRVSWWQILHRPIWSTATCVKPIYVVLIYVALISVM